MTEREERMRRLASDIVDPVRRYLHRRTDAATADDVLGDTLLVCWRRLDEVPDDALPWAIVVARNCLANAERSTRRQQRVVGKIIALDPPAEAADDLGMRGAGIQGAADSDVDASEIRTALTRLRPSDAELLRLWAWEQLTIPQLAAALDISTNAVTIRLHRAKARLREELVKAPRASGHVLHEEGSTDDRR